MKKSNILLILPVLLSFVSCSNKEATIQEQIVNSILNGVNVKIEGEERVSYPENYSYLDTVSPISIDRDYVKIKDKNGKSAPAVRENTDGDFTTYFKNEEGYAYREYLTFDNKVYEEIYEISGNMIIFNERFSNPFEFIETDDISSSFELDLTKATFLVESYTGLQYSVKEAKFNVENNKATSLDLVINDRIDIIAESETSEILLTSSLALNIDFTYGVNQISHLSPRKLNDKTLKNAFKNLTNFTLNASLESVSDTLTVYKTSSDIFFHYGKNESLNDGDKYYKSMSNGLYDEYTYSFASGEFEITNFDIEEKTFLPKYTDFSSDVLIKNSENVYEFDAASAKFALESMIVPEFGITGGLGMYGTLTLKDGNVDTISGKFYPSNPFNITQKFTNVGSTNLPDWFDTSLI